MEKTTKKMQRSGEMKLIYICKVCGKEGEKSNIKSHIQTRHIEGACIPCNLCQKTFRSNSALSVHKWRKHKWIKLKTFGRWAIWNGTIDLYALVRLPSKGHCSQFAIHLCGFACDNSRLISTMQLFTLVLEGLEFLEFGQTFREYVKYY